MRDNKATGAVKAKTNPNTAEIRSCARSLYVVIVALLLTPSVPFSQGRLRKFNQA